MDAYLVKVDQRAPGVVAVRPGASTMARSVFSLIRGWRVVAGYTESLDFPQPQMLSKTVRRRSRRRVLALRQRRAN
jgi:hypothetical protein